LRSIDSKVIRKGKQRLGQSRRAFDRGINHPFIPTEKLGTEQKAKPMETNSAKNCVVASAD
jgi:hypothetical protein